MKTAAGEEIKLPTIPKPELGGFLVDTSALKASQLPQSGTATLEGQWGFETFQGPAYHLRSSQPADWVVGSADASALIVGRDDTLHLKSEQAVCRYRRHRQR